MRSKIGKLCLRMFLIPVTGLVVFQLFTFFVSSLNGVLYDLTKKTDYHIFLRYDTRDFVVLWLTTSWLVSLFILEIFAAFLKIFPFRRFLTNLRFAPFFILLFSWAIVIFYDLGMIQYSRWQISNYLYSASPIIEKPEIALHNNYRHWCGNGFSAQENYLYFDSAAEGFNHENPYVRARSLLMAAEVQDLINGGDERFDDFLAKSCRDSEGIVRATAENYLNESDSSCQMVLSAK